MTTASTNTAPEWYRVSGVVNLWQGDVIEDLPLPVLDSHVFDDLSSGIDRKRAKIEVERGRSIVLTQSCDLANNKAPLVMVCRMFDAKLFIPKYGQRETVRKGREPNLHLLEACSVAAFERFPQQIVDFRTAQSVERSYVDRAVAKESGRVRLQSPYVEHMSQAFARYFMRIGLPRDIITEQ